MKCSPPGSSVHGILQARTLEQVAIPFSGDLPNPGIELASPAWARSFFTTEPPGKPMCEIGWPKDIRETSICWVSPMFSPSVASGSLQPRELQHARLPCPPVSQGVPYGPLFPRASVISNKEKNPSTLFISLPLRKGRWLGWDSHSPTNSKWKRKIHPKKPLAHLTVPAMNKGILGLPFPHESLSEEKLLRSKLVQEYHQGHWGEISALHTS